MILFIPPLGNGSDQTSEATFGSVEHIITRVASCLM
jgi:hypothetical protein